MLIVVVEVGMFGKHVDYSSVFTIVGMQLLASQSVTMIYVLCLVFMLTSEMVVATLDYFLLTLNSW